MNVKDVWLAMTKQSSEEGNGKAKRRGEKMFGG